MNVTYKISEVVKSDSFSNSTLAEKPAFPYHVSMGGHFCCGSSYFTARDTFQHSLLLYTLEGCGEIQYRGKTVLLPPRTMALLDSKYAHRYGSAPKEHWEFLWLHFEDFSPVSFADYLWEREIFLMSVPKDSVQEFYQELKMISLEATPPGAMRMSQQVSTFFTRWGMYNYNRLFPLPASKEYLIRKAQEYMQEHFNLEVTLDEVARWCSVSKYYLIRIFREALGITPHQYLLRIRMGQAKLLLMSTTDTVADISQQVGFSSAGSFIAVFKKMEGLTPSGFRNAGRGVRE